MRLGSQTISIINEILMRKGRIGGLGYLQKIRTLLASVAHVVFRTEKELPWQRVGMDLLDWEVTYLIIIDHYS